MLFISVDFAIFLPLFFFLYWFVTNKSLRLQNFLTLAGSYVFYGWWDWRFLSLIIASTCVDYFCGIAINSSSNGRRKFFMLMSIAFNIGLLGVFKYCNFFIENLIALSEHLGLNIDLNTLNIILPVGISFYTFQTLSYTIDIYNRKIQPTHDFIAFSAFVSFFPQLVAGPIERAANLLPQFMVARSFDYRQAVDGLRQILWGLFKKVVIADNCAIYVNLIFANPASYNGSSLALGTMLFAFQIYGDFSGYSDMAIGLSRLFGFNLMRNFAFPYFSRDIAEFWRRWHISLTTWFRDYIYIPLGGSRHGRLKSIRNTFIVFIISGLWHGANWTFITWGLLHAAFFMPLLLSGRNRQNLDSPASGRILPGIRELLRICSTFMLTCLAWIFFRAESIGHATAYLKHMLSESLFTAPEIWPSEILLLIFCLVAIEWASRTQQHALERAFLKWPAPFRWAFYYLIMLAVFYYYGDNQQQFIYFQF